MTKNSKKKPVSLFDQFEKTEKETNLIPEKKSKKTKEELEKDRRQRAKNKEGFSTTGDLLNRFQVVEKNKHISHEFQSFGCYFSNCVR